MFGNFWLCIALTVVGAERVEGGEGKGTRSYCECCDHGAVAGWLCIKRVHSEHEATDGVGDAGHGFVWDWQRL